jgi:hypothetical protein
MGKVKSSKTSKTVPVKDKKNDSLAIASKIKNFALLKKDYELFDENLTLNMILHKMADILEFYLKIVQQILQPEEFHALYECNGFTDTEKTNLMELYKRMMIVHREILRSEISNEEKDSISTIQLAHEEIVGVKPLMLDIVKKMQQSWKTATDSKTDAHRKSANYFG